VDASLEEGTHENRKEEQMARAHADLTEPAARSGPIHVVVDLNRCQGYAQCCFFAPDVFTLHGQEALWYDPAPDEAQHEHVLRAAAACPVQAIIVEWSEAANRRSVEVPHA
jgi:ferredoxin